MNVIRLLTPKSEVAYLGADMTLRQALEKMEYHRYQAVPIVDEDGKYIGHQLTLWPIHISGVTPENNYQPVLVDGEDAQKAMRMVARDHDGYVTPLKPFIDGEGAVQDFVPWTK